MDVMFYEAFAEEERILRRLLPSSIEAGFTAQTIQASFDEIPPAALISIRTQSIIPKAWDKKPTGIFSRTTGFDHLERYLQNSKNKKPCGYLLEYCSRAVAEQAVLFMLALLRKLPRQQEQMERFCRDNLTGQECRGRNALVVGVGRIGGEIADIVKALGMKVKGVDIVRRRRDIEYVPLKRGLDWAQVLFCALPLTLKTRGLLTDGLFKSRASGLFLVNVSRGEITPTQDLVRLMENRKLAGVALDVYPDEDVMAENLRALVDDHPGVQEIHRLKAFENVICTPHNAFNSEEALVEKSRQTILAVESFLKRGVFPNKVKHSRVA